MQYAMRHADPRTTMRYDMARANLDRHAAHAVAAYLAGMSTGGRTVSPGAATNATGTTAVGQPHRLANGGHTDDRPRCGCPDASHRIIAEVQ